MQPTITASTSSSVTLTWAGGDGIASQSVQYKRLRDTAWQSISVPAALTEYTVSGLIPGTAYQFKVIQQYSPSYQPPLDRLLDNPALMLDGQSSTYSTLLTESACKINLSLILDIDSVISRAVIKADAAFAIRCPGLNWTTLDNTVYTAEHEYGDYTDIISIYVNHGSGGLIYEVEVYDGSGQPLVMSSAAAVSVTHCVSGGGTFEDPLIVLQTEPAGLCLRFAAAAVHRIEVICSVESRQRFGDDWKWSQRAFGSKTYWVGTLNLDGVLLDSYTVELNGAAATAEIYGISVFARSHYVSDEPLTLIFDSQEIQHSPQGWYYSSGSTCCDDSDENEHLYYIERVAVPLEMLDSGINADFTARILINTYTEQYNLTAAGTIPYYLPVSL